MKLILDACCGGRMFWYQKNNKDTLYMDCRDVDKGAFKNGWNPNWCIKPDYKGDFRNMPFDDCSFKLVIYDPPHLTSGSMKGVINMKYGLLDKETWKEDLISGFNECYRVLDVYGTLIFKWNEANIKKEELQTQKAYNSILILWSYLMNNNSKDIKYIDLFAGIGGFHQAMNEFGAKCVLASEWDRHAAKTYYDNYGIMPKGDITKIDEKTIPKHDMLCGGFPCQAFSISGKQKGFEDTRGTLFFDIARIVQYHKPKVILLENVRNFEKHDDGRTLEKVISTLQRLDYNVFYKVLNARNYGLPQNRERIFIVCFRNGLPIEKFNFPKSYNKRTSLLDIIEDNPTDAKIINRPDTVFTKSFTPQIDLFGKIDLPNKPIQIGYVNKGGQGERIYSPYGHAITLSAYGGGAGAKTGLYFINNIIRKLSLRECARAQGFPDSFKITSSLSESYKQFGNSVAVNVLKAIIKEIYKTNCFKKNRKNT